MDKNLKINFYLKPDTTYTSRLLMCMVSFKYSEMEQFLFHRETDDYDDEGYQIMEAGVDSRVKHKSVVISTGISLPTKFWNNKKKIGIGAYSYINKQLENLEKNIHSLYDSLLFVKNLTITPEILKKEIQEHIFKKGKKEGFNLQSKFNISSLNTISTIPTILTDYIPYKIEDWKKHSPKADYRGYTKFKGWILKFEKFKGNDFKIDLLTLDNSIVKEFVEWMIRQTKPNGTLYRTGYISRLKTELKNFVNKAAQEDDMKINPLLSLNKPYLKKRLEKTDDVYLTLTQLERLKSIKFEEDEKELELVRDLYIVNCFCGVRISDFLKMDKIFYDEEFGWFFEITKTDKTDDRLKIPVFDDFVLKVFKKYGNKFPVENLSADDYNTMIKQVCIRAGFTHMVNVSHQNVQTGAQIKDKKPFYLMVTVKTARKTFASLMIRNFKVPIPVVMSWTTHSNEETLKNYIRLSPDDYFQIAAEQMATFKKNFSLSVKK